MVFSALVIIFLFLKQDSKRMGSQKKNRKRLAKDGKRTKQYGRRVFSGVQMDFSIKRISLIMSGGNAQFYRYVSC